MCAREKRDGKRGEDAKKRRGKKAVRTDKERVASLLARVWKAISNALFPSDVTCPVCGGELMFDTSLGLCSECVGRLGLIDGDRCERCGAPVSPDSRFCDRCTIAKYSFDYSRSPLKYEDIAVSMIHALKFSRRRYLAKPLAELMCVEYDESGMSADVIAYVPMAQKELKKRGFNQSELLANCVGKRLGIEVVNALHKCKETSTQRGFTAKERMQNLADAFVMVDKLAIKGKRVMLVDDVFTTGATANECAKVLLKGGASSVCVLTAAVTVQRVDNETD